MNTTTEPRRWKLVPEMEGRSARWYARVRGSAPQRATYRREAARLTADLPDGAAILEVAPGPGYHAVELARSGRFTVTALDVSRTFVQLAGELATRQGVRLDVRQGDVAAMPFPDGVFDLVVCQAAFKNFVQPVTALDEMHRVLRPGGVAVVQDMSGLASGAAIRQEVASMQVGRVAAAFTRLTLTWLRRRAHTPEAFAELARRSAFRDAAITTKGISLEVRLVRR